MMAATFKSISIIYAWTQECLLKMGFRQMFLSQIGTIVQNKNNVVLF